ncbi:hypothetical protein Tco_1152246 [Tanacetum coccineum]
MFHEKTTHFEIDLHLVREKVSDGVIKVLKVASASNVVGVFTNGLSVAQHNEFWHEPERGVELCECIVQDHGVDKTEVKVPSLYKLAYSQPRVSVVQLISLTKRSFISQLISHSLLVWFISISS